MAQYVPDILLWLFVINHGIAFSYFIPTALRLMRADAPRHRSKPWRHDGWRSITCEPHLL
jgi:hypothetical protein